MTSDILSPCSRPLPAWLSLCLLGDSIDTRAVWRKDSPPATQLRSHQHSQVGLWVIVWVRMVMWLTLYWSPPRPRPVNLILFGNSPPLHVCFEWWFLCARTVVPRQHGATSDNISCDHTRTFTDSDDPSLSSHVFLLLSPCQHGSAPTRGTPLQSNSG